MVLYSLDFKGPHTSALTCRLNGVNPGAPIQDNTNKRDAKPNARLKEIRGGKITSQPFRKNFQVGQENADD